MRAFILVFRREVIKVMSSPTYWLSVFVLPLFILFVMSTIFSTGLIRELPVGIVDLDGSMLSRSVIRNIEAVPELKVERTYSNAAEAQNDVLAKKIYGYLYIPNNFEQSVKANKAVEVPFYFHYALLSVGGEVLSGFYSYLVHLATLPLMNLAHSMDIDPYKASVIAMPVTADFHPLNNPSLDYTVYLSFTYFYVIFQVLMLLVVCYSVGREFKEGTAVEWLSTAQHSRVAALYGKLLPYFLAFSTISVFANMVLFKLVHIPLAGSMLAVAGSSVLFVAATLSVSVFIFSINPHLSSIIGFVSMFGSLGATMVGVTFPVSAMPPIVEWASTLFPAKHFTIITQNLCYEGLNFSYIWQQYLALTLFLFLPFVLIRRLFPTRMLTTNN